MTKASLTPVKCNGFTAEVAELESEVTEAFQRVMKSGWFLLGTETTLFEQELARELDMAHVVAVANGTEALAICLRACGLQPGDEVLVSAITAYPTIIGIEMAGGKAVPVDIDPATGLMDVNTLPDTTTAKYIMPVHLYGQVCDMEAVSLFAQAKNITIVEDCAQAVGAIHSGKKSGSWSQAAALSFYPTKNLGAYGDAGAIITNSAEIANLARHLRNYGQTNRYYHAEFGYNSRIDEIQAAILRVKLPHLAHWIARRQDIARYYREHLENVELLQVSLANEHTNHLFVVKSDRRDALQQHCQEHGVETLIHYPVPVHKQAAFKGGEQYHLPHAEQFCQEILSLPIHPFLRDEEVARVVEVVNSFK